MPAHDAGHSEPALDSRIAAIETFQVTETLISLQDISDKVASETIPDFACFDNTLAGIAFH